MEVEVLIQSILGQHWESTLDKVMPIVNAFSFTEVKRKATYIEFQNSDDQAICIYCDGEQVEWIQFIALYEEGIVPDTPFNPFEGRINALFEVCNRQFASTLSERRVPYTFNPKSRETGFHSDKEVEYALTAYSFILACKDNADEEGGWLEIRVRFSSSTVPAG